jgi:hypothetical protein
VPQEEEAQDRPSHLHVAPGRHSGRSGVEFGGGPRPRRLASYSLPRRKALRGIAPVRIFPDLRSRFGCPEAQRSAPGENRLGRLWMKLRDDFSKESLEDRNLVNWSQNPLGRRSHRTYSTSHVSLCFKMKCWAFSCPWRDGRKSCWGRLLKKSGLVWEPSEVARTRRPTWRPCPKNAKSHPWGWFPIRWLSVTRTFSSTPGSRPTHEPFPYIFLYRLPLRSPLQKTVRASLT